MPAGSEGDQGRREGKGRGQGSRGGAGARRNPEGGTGAGLERRNIQAEDLLGRSKPRGWGRDKPRTQGSAQDRRTEQGLVQVLKAKQGQGQAGDDGQTTNGRGPRKCRASTSRPRSSSSPSSTRRSVRAVEPRVPRPVDCTYRSTASAKLNLSGT